MSVWKLQRLGRASAATGDPFPPGCTIVTALFGEEDEAGEDRVRGSGFVRRDFLESEATEERLAGAFCVWRTRTPPEKEEGPKRFDLGMAQEFLQRLLADGDESRAAVCLTLALLLARKRRLLIEEHGADWLLARWPKETEAFRIPAPAVGEAEAETLQQDLMRLFDMDVTGTAEPDGTAEADGPADADETAEGAATPPRDAAPGGALPEGSP